MFVYGHFYDLSCELIALFYSVFAFHVFPVAQMAVENNIILHSDQETHKHAMLRRLGQTKAIRSYKKHPKQTFYQRHPGSFSLPSYRLDARSSVLTRLWRRSTSTCGISMQRTCYVNHENIWKNTCFYLFYNKFRSLTLHSFGAGFGILLPATSDSPRPTVCTTSCTGMGVKNDVKQ